MEENKNKSNFKKNGNVLFKKIYAEFLKKMFTR